MDEPLSQLDTPGCRDIVRHNENGLLIPVGDVDALCEALRELINDPDRRQEMGAAGRELAVGEFLAGFGKPIDTGDLSDLTLK